MTALEGLMVDERDSRDGAWPWRATRVVLFGLLLVIVAGAIIGFVAASHGPGHGIGAVHALVLAALVGVAGLLGWQLRRDLRRRPGDVPPTARERLNRHLLIGSGALGGVISIVIMVAGDDLSRGQLFSDRPIPTWAAIVLLLLIGGVMPVVAWVWHRNVDEQESAAYRTGALWGLYLYMIGAPAWWFAWRGGLLPEPNGTAIYLATVATVGAVWLWKKYR